MYIKSKYIIIVYKVFVYMTVTGGMKEPFLWMWSTLGAAQGSVSHIRPLPEPALCLHCNHNQQL